MATTDEPKRLDVVRKPVEALMLKLLPFCCEKSSSQVPLSSFQQTFDSLAITPHRLYVNRNLLHNRQSRETSLCEWKVDGGGWSESKETMIMHVTVARCYHSQTTHNSTHNSAKARRT